MNTGTLALMRLQKLKVTNSLLSEGDHNAHVVQERPIETNGGCGLCTPTTADGEYMLDWCEVNELKCVDSDFDLRRRGTWFKKIHRTWYKLEGFLMKKGELQLVTGNLEVTAELCLSDHKPLTLLIRIPEKKRRPRQTRNPHIN